MSTEELFNRELHCAGESWKLSSWRTIAIQEIKRWIDDEAYSDYITANVMKNEWMGPFTKFLYHFAFQCKGCGWGLMVDFNERAQRVFLPNRYYEWMHKLRDEIYEQRESTTAIESE